MNLESWYTEWKAPATKKLKLGEDFDMVLNGITTGALPHVSKQLATKNKAWHDFTQNPATKTRSVSTVTMQMWTYNTTHELGFGPKVNPDRTSNTEATICGGPEPYETWADFTHLVKLETDNAKVNGGVAKGEHHYLSVEPFNGDDDPDFSNTSLPDIMYQRAYDLAVKFVEHEIRWTLPRANYDTMVAPIGVKGVDRLKHQYWRTNFEPGDLYVLSVAGSIRSRPTPFKFPGDTPEKPIPREGAQPFTNMALAGDHTNNGLDDGCAETAVTSGIMASYGLTRGHSPAKFTDYEDKLPPDWANAMEYPLRHAIR